MSGAELREKSDQELQKFVEDEQRGLFKLKARMARKDKDVKSHEVKQARKNIARALTLMRERVNPQSKRK
jgi:large subunit ribosomal protein L29